MSETAAQTQAPQAPAAEQPKTPEVTSPSPKQDPQMASKFAALAKKERQARALQEQAKAREAELARREAAIAEREKLWDSEFKQSPLEALKKRGYSYEDLTKAALNDGKFDPATEVKEVRSEIERLRQEQAEKEKKAQEAAQKAQSEAEAQAVEAFKSQISQHIDANAEKYELTKFYDSADLVFQTVEEHFERTKKVLSIDEACGLVEQYIESELDRAAQQSKKFKSKYLAQKAAEDAKDGKSQPKTTTTLSNTLATSSAPSLLPSKTEDDRIKRALAKLG